MNTHVQGFWKSCFYFVLIFTVKSWFCWIKQCGETSQCPHVVAEWAVKLRGWALWLAGSSLPYINNYRYNRLKRFLCTNQDSSGDRRLHKSCTSFETVFKGSVWLDLSSPSLILNLLGHFSFTSHILYTLTAQHAYKHFITYTENSQHK